MSDPVHEKVIRALGGLTIDYWSYRGYQIIQGRTKRRFDLRFERGIIDKLAFCKIEIFESDFNDRFIDLRDLIETKLRRVEIELTKKRQEQLARVA